ncbi:hypothetical protein GCM10017044_21170 [Kordiimonas sediminis]|uniref:Mth938-like domain-containing protein n=1 Tax=Kordiimonas sediminis TaxID=1735581 RepID=A0A919AU11_9PROT|nr:Mth938-like domain-containing protein [Kordiimonas sediminis]GHF26079.1 hypothetical protein GCM10017044_21170 [Kordiimonas sediminis]
MSEKISSGGMVLKQEKPEDVLLVEGYGDGGFRLMGRRFDGGVLVLPSGVFPIQANSLEEVSLDDLKPALEADILPELILFGTGDRLIPVPPMIRSYLEQRRIGHDPMDTGAAARTYNILMMEHRRVAVLLIPVE